MRFTCSSAQYTRTDVRNGPPDAQHSNGQLSQGYREPSSVMNARPKLRAVCALDALAAPSHQYWSHPLCRKVRFNSRQLVCVVRAATSDRSCPDGDCTRVGTVGSGWIGWGRVGFGECFIRMGEVGNGSACYVGTKCTSARQHRVLSAYDSSIDPIVCLQRPCSNPIQPDAIPSQPNPPNSKI